MSPDHDRKQTVYSDTHLGFVLGSPRRMIDLPELLLQHSNPWWSWRKRQAPIRRRRSSRARRPVRQRIGMPWRVGRSRRSLMHETMNSMRRHRRHRHNARSRRRQRSRTAEMVFVVPRRLALWCCNSQRSWSWRVAVSRRIHRRPAIRSSTDGNKRCRYHTVRRTGIRLTLSRRRS